MSRKDEYYNRAKQEDYRARSAYKLKQLDADSGLFGPGNTVVDLGSAPGGWLQVAAEEVGKTGTVIGVDRQRIKPIQNETVECLRGDLTEPQTIEQIEATVGGSTVDVVLSDMAPNMTGEYNVDHARSIYLARQAFTVADALLCAGGDFVAKVFDGRDLDAFLSDIEDEFQYLRQMRPSASRDSSSELYIIGKHRITAPVSEDDIVDVVITDIGSQGDGVAKIDDYTVFVEGATQGDSIRVRITDVKPDFAFATAVDSDGEAKDTRSSG
jgi:23S rRNA (uridine2552-2'-O)-methyltransferase